MLGSSLVTKLQRARYSSIFSRWYFDQVCQNGYRPWIEVDENESLLASCFYRSVLSIPILALDHLNFLLHPDLNTFLFGKGGRAWDGVIESSMALGIGIDFVGVGKEIDDRA